MQITQWIQTKNRCYKAGKRITPRGIVVHSTGANNPYLKRYIGPDDGKLGKNQYNNHWNSEAADKCMHAFIGKLEDGIVAAYQTLPWDYRSWGCGKGNNGSYNDSHIQFEICEDGLTDAAYYEAAFSMAVELCAGLCRQFGIPVDNIVGHYEAHNQGYASNHGDPRTWMKKHNDSMDAFRERVRKLLGGEEVGVLISKGASGAKVEELQNMLLKAGYVLPKYGADGKFGSESVAALKKFQVDHGLPDSGVCDQTTWDELVAATSGYTIAQRVAALEEAMKKLSPDFKVGGGS